MIFLCNYSEYGAKNAPSLAQQASNVPYPEKEKIIAYLNDKSKVDGCRLQVPKDRITGERIGDGIELLHLCDGVYSWYSDLAYHVEKYNLRLPKEFEEYVLKHS